ncbi:MAG: hemerythrin domain-containing protein [Candidatus Omnitrophica bacterium]|nr:hemerythrin domain-containing protein [Candidatus Omnitrophota bacterium]
MLSARKGSCSHFVAAALIVWLAVGSPAAAQQEPPPASARVFDWLEREHGFLRRYLALVRQAEHDYRYGYQTPALLMPVAIDLFTGYVVHHHLGEEQALYPVLRSRMRADQQKTLSLIEHDQQTERETVKRWQQQLDRLQPGAKLDAVVDEIDYLAQMVNRHLVFQEEKVYPALETLAPTEQAAILEAIAAAEREAFGATGRQRYEQLLAYIEGEVKRLAGRIW